MITTTVLWAVHFVTEGLKPKLPQWTPNGPQWQKWKLEKENELPNMLEKGIIPNTYVGSNCQCTSIFPACMYFIMPHLKLHIVIESLFTPFSKFFLYLYPYENISILLRFIITIFEEWSIYHSVKRRISKNINSNTWWDITNLRSFD